MDQKHWAKEYAEFVQSEAELPPQELSRRLLENVRGSLNPSAFRVLGKLGLIHLFAGGLTLSVCPQFGIGPLGGGHGLMAVFMDFGPWACAMFCGSFFLGMTGLAAIVALRPEEARVLFRNQLWLFSALAIFSFVALMLLGAAAHGHPAQPAPEFVTTWLLAAVLGSQLTLQAGAWIRRKFQPDWAFSQVS